MEQRPPDGVLQAVVFHLAFDEVRDDLGIRLRDEDVPLFLKLRLQFEIVLDDAVVDDDDPAGAVAVRVRVLLGGPAVSRPSRVADAVLPLERIHRDHFLEPSELARAAPQLDRAVAHDSHAGRIVSAVLEAPQSVDEDRKDLFLADVADDPAHGECPYPRPRFRF